METTFPTTVQEYIEVIYELEKTKRVARVKDIAERRGVNKSSVSLVLNQLQKHNLIDKEQYGHITLTTNGKKLGQKLEKRHQTLKKFLIDVLNISEETAEIDACKIEHIISQDSLDGFEHLLEFTQTFPKKWERVFKSLKEFHHQEA